MLSTMVSKDDDVEPGRQKQYSDENVFDERFKTGKEAKSASTQKNQNLMRRRRVRTNASLQVPFSQSR